MTVDIIILSFARTMRLAEITQQTINTCHSSERDIKFNILVLEQNTNALYSNCTTRHTTAEFNYNRFMNTGINSTASEYVCLCNNDLIFHKGWCRNIIDAMEKEHLLSASPLCPNAQGVNYPHGPAIEYGYSNARHLSGWCIMCNRFLFEIIGKLDEEFPFWFADNAYSEQLKKFKVKHALVRSSIVTHIASSTLKGLGKEKYNALTIDHARKFIEKYPENESAVFFKKYLDGR